MRRDSISERTKWEGAAMASDLEQNPYLTGNFGPWRVEGDAVDLEVVGKLPDGLNGTFYRNGPNPAYEPLGKYHWFDGDGMIHAIRIADGRASYRNRYVQSSGLMEERRSGRALFKGLRELSPTEMPQFKNTGNTNIVYHGGKLLALMEAALPTQLRRCSLETLGEWDFDGRLQGPMTAHPKLDPKTGEMLFFGYSPMPPYLTYHVADADGVLLRSVPIDLEWPSMIHDFAVTENFVVFIVGPLVFSFEQLMAGGEVFSWEPERGMRFGIMPRNGGSGDVKWFHDDAGYIFHPMNAYEDGEEIVLDAARFGRMLFMNPDSDTPVDPSLDSPLLHRWRFHRSSGALRRTQLDDRPGEFPRVDERRVGLRHRFGYLAAQGPEDPVYKAPLFTAIHKYDIDGGTSERRAFGANNGVGEPLFVPRTPGASEDDGYVLVLVFQHERNTSEFLVLDSRNIDGEPVAVVRLPHRVPYGFHGNWVEATA